MVMNMNNSVDKVEFELLNRFIPILYIHPDEKTSPMSVNTYINNCELCVGGSKKKIQKNIFCKPVIIRKNNNILLNKGEIILPLQSKYNIIPDKYMNYCGKSYLPQRHVINLIPIYGLVEYYKNFIDIIYIFNYYYNNSYKWCGIYVGGEHQADIEHIRIRVKNNSNLLFNENSIKNNEYIIQSIYFSAHTSDQGRWVKFNDIKWYNNKPNGQPMVYVAKGSHANYPSPGTWYRIFGFANDKTKNKDKSIKWQPNEVINLKDRDDLMSYQGSMGNNGVDDFNRNWKNAPSPNIHPGFWYRFFYPLSKFLSSCSFSRK